MERSQLIGKVLPLRGNDIDTDRIIPARFLKCVTFDGLGEHVFKDDRFFSDGRSKNHAFDDERFQGATLLSVNKNFGCGSSREHAPQALKRYGINAIIGESFAEIFFGNCVALGVPCLTLSEKDLSHFQDENEKKPDSLYSIDLEDLTLKRNGEDFLVLTMPSSVQEMFLKGTWDVTDLLLKNASKIEQLTSTLPYW